MTGDDLIEFVNRQLFPYLQGFKQRAAGPDTIEYKVGEIFSEIKNRFQSGYSLRDALELIDGLRFQSQTEKHELSHLYEAKIRNMGNAGRNGGEYYTPRPLIRAMIQVTKPRIGETIYDGALLFIDVQNYNAGPDGGEFADMNPAERDARYGWFFRTMQATAVPNMQRVQAACRQGGIEVMYTIIENLTQDAGTAAWTTRSAA